MEGAVFLYLFIGFIFGIMFIGFLRLRGSLKVGCDRCGRSDLKLIEIEGLDETVCINCYLTIYW